MSKSAFRLSMVASVSLCVACANTSSSGTGSTGETDAGAGLVDVKFDAVGAKDGAVADAAKPDGGTTKPDAVGDGACFYPCDDNNECTDDWCDNGSCKHINNKATCNNGAGQCSAGKCGPGGADAGSTALIMCRPSRSPKLPASSKTIRPLVPPEIGVVLTTSVGVDH